MAGETETTDEQRHLAYRCLCVLSMNIILLILLIPGIIRKVREFLDRRRQAAINYEWTVSPAVAAHFTGVKNALLLPDLYAKELNSVFENMLLETMVPNSSGDIQEAFAEDFAAEVDGVVKLKNMQKEEEDAIKLIKASAAREADCI